MTIDISKEACAVVCMLVSNPEGALRKDGDGWQRRVNDVIRALRNELDAAEARAKRLAEALRFYANDDNWGPTPLGDDIFEISAIEQDRGQHRPRRPLRGNDMSARDEFAWVECMSIGSGRPTAKRCQDGAPCEACYERADGRISALAAAGYKIVSREPTKDALAVGANVLVNSQGHKGVAELAVYPVYEIFTAMFDAAPPHPPQEKQT
jgi:hypothetical protein